MLRTKHVQNANDSPETGEDASVAIEHLAFLCDFIREENATSLEEINSLLSHGEITFDLAWALFVPRTILYTACPVSGAPRAVRLIQAEKSSRPGGSGGAQQFWRLDVEYMDYKANSTGSDRFGLAPLANIEVPKFNGAVKITTLPTYPMKYYPTEGELTARLIERGKKWCSLQGVHHKYYNGTGFHYKDGKYVKLNVRTTDSFVMQLLTVMTLFSDRQSYNGRLGCVYLCFNILMLLTVFHSNDRYLPTNYTQLSISDRYKDTLWRRCGSTYSYSTHGQQL